MYHYFDDVRTPQGPVLAGFYVRLVDSTTGETASLYADASQTPIVTVSGIADAALVDGDGNANFYVDSGTYHIDYYAQDGVTLVKRVVDVPMISLGDASAVDFIAAGDGAVSRTVQDKLRDNVSVLDFGADPTGAVDSEPSFTAAAASGGLIVVPKGSYLLSSAPTLGAAVFRYDKGVTLSGAGASGTWAVSGTSSVQYVQTEAASTDVATEFIRREANYTGGTSGFTSVALRVQTDVSADVANYEWNGLFELNNSATAGQNAALYAQANKNSTGPTWALVTEVKDSTGGDTGGLVGHEVDVLANGSDTNNNRVGIDIVGGRYGGTGTLAEIGYGIRISPQNFDTANALFKCGFQLNGLCNTGIDFTNATVSGNVFQSPGCVIDGNGSPTFTPPASSTPSGNGQMTFELTNNTTLKIHVKGSDGTVRSSTLTLS